MMSVKEQVAQALKTVKQMLTDRGEALGDLEAVGDAEIAAVADSSDTFHFSAAERDVLFITRKLRRELLTKGKNALDDERRGRAILVTMDKPASTNVQYVKEHFGPRAELFTLRELQVNVTRHAVVPLHEKMAPEEVERILTMYNISKNQMPALLSSDPVARYLGLVAGDVVRITRRSPSAGEAVAYRVVV